MGYDVICHHMTSYDVVKLALFFTPHFSVTTSSFRKQLRHIRLHFYFPIELDYINTGEQFDRFLAQH